MAKYYWRGGSFSGSPIYDFDEAFPESYCWNIASNWYVRVEGPTGPSGGEDSTTGWHLERATTPPGGGDLVFFENFNEEKANSYGVSSFPMTPCLFGGYITDWEQGETLGWINASSTGGFVSVVIQPEYGVTSTNGSPSVGPTSRIGSSQGDERNNILNDYWRDPTIFVGINWPQGVSGFGGLRLNASSIRDFHRQVGSDPGIASFCRITLDQTICSAFVSEASPTTYHFHGGTYTQMFFNDIPPDNSTYQLGGGHSIKTFDDDVPFMGEKNHTSILNYLYLGSVFGGKTSGNGSYGNARFILSSDVQRVDIDPLVLTTIGNTGITAVRFSLLGATLDQVNLYPRARSGFNPTEPFGGYDPVLFAGTIGSQGTINTLTLHESSRDDPDRTIIDRLFYWPYYDFTHPTLGSTGDFFSGANNPTMLNNVTVNTLNLDGGRVSLYREMSEEDSVEIQTGRIGSESILDLIPDDPFVTGIKIGTGTSHPRTGAGLMISPVGGQIKLPLQMRFVADYKTGKGPTFEIVLPGIGPSRPR